ncbi:ATP-dependent Clp protease proteolytic subunit [Candidatus Saccharibacteria bacterium]|nr:ATP-dependent Clp protease proteolytic subunit [Candidatus Saccharibacteria bacterium]
MLQMVPDLLQVKCDIEGYTHLKDLERRKLYLSGEINSLECEEGCNELLSRTNHIIRQIVEYNEDDKELPSDERIPIRLFINSPGGDVAEGFPLVSIIELSKTPVYTINIGKWASMSFWIGITGHKRFALPYTEFLMHEGSLFTAGSVGSVQDTVDFNQRYKEEVIRTHVLKHSNMNSEEYDATLRREYYMLPGDALKHGFIDEIVTDINAIL